jgi:hypothetical protein
MSGEKLVVGRKEEAPRRADWEGEIPLGIGEGADEGLKGNWED